MLDGYVKPTTNCAGLPLGWDEGIEVIEDLGQHAQARVKTGDPLRTRTVVGWTDLLGGSAQPLHAYRAKWDGRTGILLTGGNSGLRILANGRERGDGSHLTPGWGTPIMWIDDEGDLKGFVETHGGPRPGAGRPTKRVTIDANDQFFVSTANANGRQVGMSEIWQVVSVSRSIILLRSQQTGGTIKLVR